MKTFKLLDIIVSAGLIIFVVYSTFITHDMFLEGYFIVGGWQVVSMLVHATFKWFTPKGSTRRQYHRVVLITLILVGVSYLAFEFYPSTIAGCILVILILHLFVFSPVMAVWYTLMCGEELKKLKKRPLATLK
jgi:hypothetical protein